MNVVVLWSTIFQRQSMKIGWIPSKNHPEINFKFFRNWKISWKQWQLLTKLISRNFTPPEVPPKNFRVFWELYSNKPKCFFHPTQVFCMIIDLWMRKKVTPFTSFILGITLLEKSKKEETPFLPFFHYYSPFFFLLVSIVKRGHREQFSRFFFRFLIDLL